jgi:hypothetical protein
MGQAFGGPEIAQTLASYEVAPGDNDAIVQKVALLMDERAQRADLSRASASMLLSLWTRNMGFVTGMILAMVGAAFILSRLDDKGSELTAEQGTIKGSLKTSSPGIVLTTLGSVLMVMAMTVRHTETGREHVQQPVGWATPEPVTTTMLPEDSSGNFAPADGAAGTAPVLPE